MNRWLVAHITRVGGALGSTSTRAAMVGAVCLAVLSLARTLPSQVLRHAESPPSGGSDAQDYDNLALSLARGRGFAYCWSDPEWRAPYKLAQPTASDWQLSVQGPCIPTARRAPGCPAVLAAVYWVGGRSFMAGRALGAVALAMAGAIGVFLVVRSGGLAAGVPMALCFLLDRPLQQYVGGLRAEPLAALAVMAMLAAHEASSETLDTPRESSRGRSSVSWCSFVISPSCCGSSASAEPRSSSWVHGHHEDSGLPMPAPPFSSSCPGAYATASFWMR